jgi:NADH:ubiquinone oxidoreductase subunit F (NADH-binding)
MRLLPAPVRFRASLNDPIHGPDPHCLDGHLATYGEVPGDACGYDSPLTSRGRVLDALAAIQLSGRGGGHFPVARKWAAARPGGVAVANGAEGEPDSRKDAALLCLRPHLVLDGLAVAAAAVGARESVVWLHEGARRAIAAVSIALEERAGLDLVPARIALGPDRYLTGESSSIVAGLAGGPVLPTYRRAPAAASGVLVHNVETLAHVALAARLGAAYLPGTLLTIADANLRTVVEAGPGQRLADLIAPWGWPDAALVGGLGGTWAPWADIAMLPLEPAAFAAAGIPLGAGVVRLLGPSESGLRTAAQFAEQLADAGARQCGPCKFGLPTVAAALDDLTVRRWGRRRAAARLRGHLAEIDGRGGCHHPDGAVRMIRSALATFSDV